MTERYGQNSSPFGYEDLQVYQAARALRRRIYRLVRMLPDDERFALAQQMRRAAASITANLAEGYGRHNWQESSQFCRQARGSLLELAEHVQVCIDEGYAEAEHLEALRNNDIMDVLRLLNGYIRYLQNRKVAEKQ
ncbi:MAG: four helix bundle protein [Phycisphaerae bacterium]